MIIRPSRLGTGTIPYGFYQSFMHDLNAIILCMRRLHEVVSRILATQRCSPRLELVLRAYLRPGSHLFLCRSASRHHLDRLVLTYLHISCYLDSGFSVCVYLCPWPTPGGHMLAAVVVRAQLGDRMHLTSAHCQRLPTTSVHQRTSYIVLISIDFQYRYATTFAFGVWHLAKNIGTMGRVAPTVVQPAAHTSPNRIGYILSYVCPTFSPSVGCQPRKQWAFDEYCFRQSTLNGQQQIFRIGAWGICITGT
ncbi:hypothetical protein BOTBODRAFT_345147 [Botryobasidium botryosum FD-172 SS1]|uniref:Uncharacterized protein n=1 Tax=Botryobasidium botryosum (strain FD-172 SS1) TaxID=930990 RepID=A0A067MFG4_BOTB1|nr:hypothetical protein BOTBODRAFT_345147 [Botryobasidium botryosum FD-172 SS1]